MTDFPVARVTRLSAIVVVTHDAQQLARFYEDLLGFSRTEETRLSGLGFEARMGLPGSAQAIHLRLGEERIELVQCDRPGATYPDGVAGDDPRFQHFAVVVSDMAAAWALLKDAPGWTPISQDGPVRLPPRSGAVEAMKFRDPEGHPLELLAFPAAATPQSWRGQRGLFLGIDHSAITVADPRRSIEFYKGLGMSITAQTHNVGIEQSRLDGVAGADVAVAALSPSEPDPHVELLGYASVRPPTPVGPTDVAATRMIFAGSTSATLADPDGHRLAVLS